MQPDIKGQGRTDYTKHVRPRGRSMDGLSGGGFNSRPMARPAVRPASTALPAQHQAHRSKKGIHHHKNDEEYRVSVSFSLPDYEQWRVAKFARQYPFLSIVIAALGLLTFALFIEGMLAIWHHFHQPPVLPPALMRIGL